MSTVLKGSQSEGSTVRARVPYLVLAGCLLVTLAATYYLAAGAQERDWLRFLSLAQQTQDSIEIRMEAYIAVLRATAGLYDASDEVTLPEFRTFVNSIDLPHRYPGIQGVGFTRRMAPTDKDAVVAAIRRRVHPDFTIRPDHARSEYHAIVYLEPLDRRNQAAIGYDMSTEPVRRAAMERARDTGVPSVSGRVTLVQEIDEKKQAGFLIYVPVYRHEMPLETVADRRAALEGYVYSPFRGDDLLHGIFAAGSSPEIAFQLFAGPEPRPEDLIHGSAPAVSGTPERARLETTKAFRVADSTWSLAFATLPAFDAGSRKGEVALLLVISLAISGMLFAVIRSQVHARGAAERIAADLARQARQMQALAETGRSLSEALDLDVVGRWITESLRSLVSVSRVTLYRLEPQTGDLMALRKATGDPAARAGRLDHVPAGTGVIGRSVEDRAPVSTADLLHDPRIRLTPLQRERVETTDNRAVLAVPLIVRDRVIGALSLGDRTGRVFNEEEIRLIRAFADQAAIALHHAQVYAETEQARGEATELAQAARDLTETLDVTTVGDRIVERVLPLFSARLAIVRALEPDGALRVIAASGPARVPFGPGHLLPAGVGLMSRVVTEGRPIWTTDVRTDSTIARSADYTERLVESGTEAAAVVPLRVKGRIIGVLGISDAVGRVFSPREVALLQAFADQAALALENARLYHGAEERARRLSALSALTRVITSAVPGGEVFNAVAQVATTLLGAKATRVWLDDREARALRNRGSFGLDRERERATTDFPVLPYGKGLVGHVFATGTAAYLSDIQQDPRSLNQRLAREADLHVFAGLPLRSGDRPMGVLALLFGRRSVFTEEEKELMQLLADHAAIAITNAELFTREQESRVEAEASARAVRDNEERIRLIIETSLEAVITMDAQGGITGWNPQAEQMFGWTRQEVLGRSLAETVVPERDREAHRRGLRHFLATGVGPILNKRIEVMALRRDGREFPVELTISAAHLGNTVLFSGFVRDLAERKRAERRQAVQFAVARVLGETTTLSEGILPLLEAIGVSTGWELAELWNVDAEGQVLRWGGAWHTPALEAGEFVALSREMTLVSGADVPGRAWASDESVWATDTLAELHPARAAAAAQLGLRAALGVPVHGTTGVIALLTLLSRSPQPRDDDLASVMDDVSGRIGQFIEGQRAQEALDQAEAHVRQLQRLEAVGRLAGGVAHDFNNLLTVIMGRGDMLLGRLPDDHPHRRDIALIKKTAERAAALTKQLLAFSRKQILAPKVLDLNTVVSGMVTMLQRLIGEDIELVFFAGSELGRVKADPGQLEQVIANLAVNARDAMPNGGRLTLETAAVELGEHYVKQHVGVQAGSYVMLGVTTRELAWIGRRKRASSSRSSRRRSQGKAPGWACRRSTGL